MAKKHRAHKISEDEYEYRGWTIYHNTEAKIWCPILNGEWNWSADTLREAKQGIDDYENEKERGLII